MALREQEQQRRGLPAIEQLAGFGLESLMSTHPPLQNRIEQLARIAAEMGQR